MATYYEHLIKWVQSFPMPIGCAVLSSIVTIFHSPIPPEILKTYFFTEYYGIYFWIVILSPFVLLIIKIEKKKRKYPKKYLTNNGKKSFRLFLDESHEPSFVGMDMISLVTILVVLMIDSGIAYTKDGFEAAHFFEEYMSILIIPFLSFVIYYGKVIREESKPNRIINPWG